MINQEKITVELIDEMIGKFYRENGESEVVLNSLFMHANNSDIENVFCRVACIDSIYSTQIQRFNKNGIYIVSEHIKKHASMIDAAFLKGEPDFDLYDDLIKVNFVKEIKNKAGTDETKIKKLHSFMSKFLSFSMPDVYPIMDSRVKKIIGFHSSNYEKYYEKVCGEKAKCCNDLGIYLTLKQWDMFLWQWAKELENE